MYKLVAYSGCLFFLENLDEFAAALAAVSGTDTAQLHISTQVFSSTKRFSKPILTMAMTSPTPLNVSIKNPDDLSFNTSPRSAYLKEDDDFPRIVLTDENGRPISLHAQNNRPKLVVFYRGAFCNYCEGDFMSLDSKLPSS